MFCGTNDRHFLGWLVVVLDCLGSFFVDSLDGHVVGHGIGDTRRYHPRTALYQTSQSTLLPYRRQSLSRVKQSFHLMCKKSLFTLRSRAQRSGKEAFSMSCSPFRSTMCVKVLILANRARPIDFKLFRLFNLSLSLIFNLVALLPCIPSDDAAFSKTRWIALHRRARRRLRETFTRPPVIHRDVLAYLFLFVTFPF